MFEVMAKVVDEKGLADLGIRLVVLGTNVLRMRDIENMRSMENGKGRGDI